MTATGISCKQTLFRTMDSSSRMSGLLSTYRYRKWMAENSDDARLLCHCVFEATGIFSSGCSIPFAFLKFSCKVARKSNSCSMSFFRDKKMGVHMKRNCRILVGLMFVFFMADSLSAQWTEVLRPFGRSSICFAVLGTKIFVGADVGVFCSTDVGAAWIECNEGLRYPHVLSLAASPAEIPEKSLYAGTDHGVFKSVDSGRSWFAMNTGMEGVPIQLLTVSHDGVGGEILIAVSRDGDVFRSSDGGTSWNRTNDGLTDNHVSVIVSADSNIFIGTNNGSGGYLFRSVNMGASWLAVQPPPCSDGVTAIAISDSNIFIATRDKIIRSMDVGRSWARVYTDSSGSTGEIVTLGVKDDTILAGNTNGEIIRSTDKGDSWKRVGRLLGLRSSSLVFCETAVFAGTILETPGTELHISRDIGTSWQPVNQLATTDYTDHLVAASNGSRVIKLVAAAYNGGIWYSMDNGKTWRIRNVDYPKESSIMAIASFDSAVFVGTGFFGLYDHSYGGTIYSSRSDRSEWNIFDADTRALTHPCVYSFCIVKNQYHRLVVFAGTTNGIFRSVDSGRTWNVVHAPAIVAEFNFVFASSTDQQGSTNIFVANYNEGVLLSSDYGDTWRSINNGLTEWIQIRNLVVSGNTIYAFTVDGSLFKSTNNGSLWTEVYSGFPYGTPATVVPLQWTDAFIASDSSRVFLSLDNGSSWSSFTSGLPKAMPRKFVISENQIFVVMDDRRMYRRLLTDILTSVVPYQAAKPSNVMLAQNYPNPSHHSTVIAYELPSATHVTLQVFDLSGRLVKTLVDGFQEAGQQSRYFDASGLPGGVYYYRLQAGAMSETKKLVVMK